MREERLFPCCDCREAFYAVKLSDSDAESYDENVDVSPDGEPDIDSFENWLRDNEDLDDLYHACPDCGSDS
ncbi:hypothetical protein AB6V67_11750 [Serratia marcescens]|uniref:hypothetical protein n=1 Tax=Serratia TaxID=613 RepID=UPI00345BEA8A